MGKHITDRITIKDENSKNKHEAARGGKKSKVREMQERLLVILEKRKRQLNLIKETTLIEKQMEEWHCMAKSNEKYLKNKENEPKEIRLFEENECDKIRLSCPV
jgi:hypothetical protein